MSMCFVSAYGHFRELVSPVEDLNNLSEQWPLWWTLAPYLDTNTTYVHELLNIPSADFSHGVSLFSAYEEKYQTIFTVLFAIEEINKNEDLLPNITLGIHLFESFMNEAETLKGYMEILSGWRFQTPNYKCESQGHLVAVVGFASSVLSLLVANTFGIYGYPQLHQFLRRVHFTNSAGEDVYFDEHGDAAPMYDLINWVTGRKEKLRSVRVGNITSSSGDNVTVNVSAIVWADPLAQEPPRSVCSDSCRAGSRKMILEGKPICCYDCVPCPRGQVTNHTDMSSCWKCPDDQWPNGKKNECIEKQMIYLSYEDFLGTALTCSAIVLSLASLFILAIFIHYQNSLVIKATNRNLSFLLLLSLTFTFCSCLVFVGHPGHITCLLRQTVFGMSFTVSVSSLLAKTILVVTAFRAIKPGSQMRRFMGRKLPWAIVGFSSSFQAIICALWLGTHPPTQFLDLHSQDGQIIVECEEHLGFYLMLSFIGCLAMGCSIIAFPARNLPDRYNEAKFITFSMLVFFSVWISFIPAYLSTNGKYTVAVEVFAILVSAAGVLGCIFFPKCFIIFYAPEK
ncbi:vomeronasal type-2 receptor 26-like [Ranitomeya variabilis]|uniref:vomeronasal type-2 receptor 26-like n=1 Tax=Ranitomeya variabilis TaxID=490064 RepID=UPI004056371F